MNNQKIEYINRLFGSNVITEFSMSDEDINKMLTEDADGVDIVAKYEPFMAVSRIMRGIGEDLSEMVVAVVAGMEEIVK